MAIRKIYTDVKGPYFKGEGYIFYVKKSFVLSTHVNVKSVNCGQGGAIAFYMSLDGKRMYYTFSLSRSLHPNVQSHVSRVWRTEFALDAANR